MLAFRDMDMECNDRNLLAAAGYELGFVPEHWEDVGGPESGPKISGHPAYVECFNEKAGHLLIVHGGEVVCNENVQPWEDIPF